MVLLVVAVLGATVLVAAAWAAVVLVAVVWVAVVWVAAVWVVAAVCWYDEVPASSWEGEAAGSGEEYQSATPVQARLLHLCYRSLA